MADVDDAALAAAVVVIAGDIVIAIALSFGYGFMLVTTDNYRSSELLITFRSCVRECSTTHISTSKICFSRLRLICATSKKEERALPSPIDRRNY